MSEKRSRVKDRCLAFGTMGLFCILLVLSFSVVSVSAQEADDAEGDNLVQLEEIVVTAERREQTLQKTPLAVSAVTGDSLARTGVNAFVDVLRTVPNVQLQVVGNPGSPTTVAIRGIGTDGPGKQVSTLIYEDGINAYLLDNFFYDVARVEVLRGPQGTLYGGTATGGAVNVITNDPTVDAFSGSATLELGNHNLRHGQIVLNAPASDTLALRVAANYLRYDQYSGSDDPPAKDALNARAKVLWEPTDRFSLLAGVDYFGDKGLDRDLIFLDANSELTSKTRVPQTGSKDLEVTRYYANVNVEMLKKDMLAAGFVLDSESAALANFGDDHSTPAGDVTGHGRSDQFLLRFKKPLDAPPDKRHPDTALKNYFGNTFHIGPNPPLRIMFHPDHRYQEYEDDSAWLTSGYWYADADGHVCLLHETGPAPGFTSCHPFWPDEVDKKPDDHWIQLGSIGDPWEAWLEEGIVLPDVPDDPKAQPTFGGSE